MRALTVGLAAAAGAATFLAVGAALSQALLPYVEFSVLVGVPAGVAAGALAAAFVLVAAGEGTDLGRRRAATAGGRFGVASLAAVGICAVLRLREGARRVAGRVSRAGVPGGPGSESGRTAGPASPRVTAVIRRAGDPRV